MPTGTVKFFNGVKGFGFIAPDGGGKEAFVHVSAVERAGLTTLSQKQRIRYDVQADQSGKDAAVNLQAV
jgi:CspA family cold shock protein